MKYLSRLRRKFKSFFSQTITQENQGVKISVCEAEETIIHSDNRVTYSPPSMNVQTSLSIEDNNFMDQDAEDIPPEYLVKQRDFVFFYAEADRVEALKCFTKLNEIGAKHGFDGVLFNDANALGYNVQSEFILVDELVKCSTMMLIYITKNSKEDLISQQHKDELLSISLQKNSGKRHCFVPVFSRPKNDFGRLPYGLNALCGIHPWCEQYYQDNVIKMFTSKATVSKKIKRCKLLEQQKREWLEEEAWRRQWQKEQEEKDAAQRKKQFVEELERESKLKKVSASQKTVHQSHSSARVVNFYHQPNFTINNFKPSDKELLRPSSPSEYEFVPEEEEVNKKMEETPSLPSSVSDDRKKYPLSSHVSRDACSVSVPPKDEPSDSQPPHETYKPEVYSPDTANEHSEVFSEPTKNDSCATGSEQNQHLKNVEINFHTNNRQLASPVENSDRESEEGSPSSSPPSSSPPPSSPPPSLAIVAKTEKPSATARIPVRHIDDSGKDLWIEQSLASVCEMPSVEGSLSSSAVNVVDQRPNGVIPLFVEEMFDNRDASDHDEESSYFVRPAESGGEHSVSESEESSKNISFSEQSSASNIPSISEQFSTFNDGRTEDTAVGGILPSFEEMGISMDGAK